MKTLLTLITFIFIFSYAKAQSLFHEDFENPDSVVSSGSIGFAQCTRISAGGNACDSSSYGVGDSCYLTTISFSTVGASTVVLSFDQIAKIEFFDLGIVQVSSDGGLTWTNLTGAQYMGTSNFANQGNKFTEAAYPTWEPATISTPQNTWWKKDIFDMSAVAANSSNVMIRFKMFDNNNNGMAGRTGWYIDNINVGQDYFGVYNNGFGQWDFSPCNTPQLYVFMTSILQAGYSYNDSVPVYIDFGDGTDSTFYAHPDTLGFFTSFYVLHYYAQLGSYNVFQSIADLVGNANTFTDTLVIDSSACTNFAGKVYFDNNANCIYDSGDAPIGQAALTLKSNAGIILKTFYTDNNGDYGTTENSALPYQMNLGSNQMILPIICPATIPVIINANPSYNNDFSIGCVPGFDGYVNATLTGMRLPSMVIIYAGSENKYCQTDTGYLKVVLDNKLNFYGATPFGYSVNGDTVTWSNILYSSQLNYHVIYATKQPTVVLGDTICVTYIAETLPGDLNPANNITSICGIVNNSYDPNYKEVNPPSTIDTNATLDYTIHFQNTGNDTAYQVIITDTLDANLDVSSLRINGGSHNFSTNVYPNNLLVFTFNNIMLPDSGANQLASNGFVSYSIKLKPATAVGTHIYNNSMIFFDSNQPVKTNTTDNLIVIPNGINPVEIGNEISVYPNPATNSVTVKLNNSLQTPNRIQLFNMLGENVFLKNSNISNETIIQLAQLPKGVYTLAIENKNNIITKKILKL
ncbi:MAG: T9SS type A sorting domain-containing protein [Bacteroidia bacterium]